MAPSDSCRQTGVGQTSRLGDSQRRISTNACSSKPESSQHGIHPFDVAKTMTFIQASGLIDTVNAEGDSVGPDLADTVVLTAMGAKEVARCIALDEANDKPRFDPNNN